MQTIYLDISNKGVIPCVLAKQSEVGRKFLAVITDNGVPYNISNDSLISVWYEGETDAGNYSSIEDRSAFIIDGNKVSVELVAQMLLNPGKGELCLSIAHGDGGETNTWNIPYSVEYKPGAGSAVPTEYYTALTNAAALAAEKVGFAKQHADDAKAFSEEAKTAVNGYVKADGTVAMTGALDMSGKSIKNVGDPVEEMDAANSSWVKSLVQTMIPIGYIFHWLPVEGVNIDLSSPENVRSYFGFGVWERVQDCFLYSSSSTVMAGSVGGSNEISISEQNIPKHRHQIQVAQETTGNMTAPDTIAVYREKGQSTQYVGSTYTGYVGAGDPIEYMPPYKAVYTWQRIA